MKTLHTKQEIFALARELMQKHGIGHWDLKWINSHSYAGLCWTYHWHTTPSLSRGKIELSWNFFEVFSDFDIKDTILHEIAHALTPTPVQKTSTGRTRRIQHGAEWKAKAKEIGCTGQRCVSETAAKPKSKYKGICPNGHESNANRLTWGAKHGRSCGKCDNTFNPKYMFDWYRDGQLVFAQAAVTPVQPKVEPVPVVAPAMAHAADISDWDRQAALIKEILKQGV
jgi:predicted SprT family Zn-dependent metalloprotease